MRFTVIAGNSFTTVFGVAQSTSSVSHVIGAVDVYQYPRRSTLAKVSQINFNNVYSLNNKCQFCFVHNSRNANRIGTIFDKQQEQNISIGYK